MGKTSMTYAGLMGIDMLEGNVFPVLIVAPKRVALNVWPDEAVKWDFLSGLKVSPIVGSAAQRLAALDKRADVYTINYENLVWLTDTLGSKWPFRTIVADESTKLKSHRCSWSANKDGTPSFKRAGSVNSSALASVAHRSKRFINLTGTPTPNGVKDLWGQTWFLDWGKSLGRTYSAFSSRWFINRIGTSKEQAVFEPRPGATEEILQRCKHLYLSLSPEDWFDIDQPRIHDIVVELPKNAMALHNKMAREGLMALSHDKMITAVNAGAKMQKCLQIASGFVYDTPEGVPDPQRTVEDIHTAALDALDELVDELGGDPLIVAYQFEHDLTRIKKRIPSAVLLDTNKETENRWNKGQIPVLLVHPKSAGHGLNLQYGGNSICIFAPTFNLEDYQQVIERVGPVRQMQAGFTRGTDIYRIVAKGTWAEKAVAVLDGKATIQEIVMSEMKGVYV